MKWDECVTEKFVDFVLGNEAVRVMAKVSIFLLLPAM